MPFRARPKAITSNFRRAIYQRSHPSSSSQKLPKITTDVQAALTVIRRRIVEQEDPKKQILNLNSTNLSGANLIKANLYGANLYGANLSGANLREAKLRNTKNLTPEQVKSAKNWEQADYDPDFRQQLGLPPEKKK